MKFSKEIKTAALVILGIFLIIYLVNFLKGEDIFSNENTFVTEFDYNALNSSSPVTIKGNAVGKVENIVYDFKTGKTRVFFRVDPNLKFSKNSIIKLYETGIMSGNGLAIIEANDKDFAKSGDFIKSEVEPGLISSLSKNFSGLSSDLDSTLRSADTLLVNLNYLVTDESKNGVKATIAELNTTLKSFKTLSYTIQNTVKKNDEKLTETLNNFNKTSQNISALSEDLKNVQISKTITNLDNTLTSLNAIMTDIKAGKGSIGKLLKDETLYTNIENATKEMEELLKDIKLHPKRYFRILSKKEIPYQKESN